MLVVGRLGLFSRAAVFEDVIDPAVGFGFEERDVCDGARERLVGGHCRRGKWAGGVVGGW